MNRPDDWDRMAGVLRKKRAAPVASDERFVGRVMLRVRARAERASVWDRLVGGWRGMVFAAAAVCVLVWWGGQEESGEANGWLELSVASVDTAAGPWGEGGE